MISAEKFIREKLDERKLTGTYRKLTPESGLVDFCSNDYLGFAGSGDLKNRIEAEIKNYPASLNGSTGSRLLTGNLTYTENLEKEISTYHKQEAGLIFNSGYDANVGLFSSVPQRGDTIIIDELAHASIIDGARMRYSSRFSFKHNDLHSLEQKLQHARGNSYVAIESIYSMDGDTPPIKEMIKLTKKYNAALIVDEAHAVGLYGNGIINQLGFEHEVFARVVTFGKALGCHGAVVLGSALLRQYLINFARPFIYSTAASFHQMAAVKMAYGLLPQSQNAVQQLRNNINLFKQNLKTVAGCQLIVSDSAIQCLVAGSNEKAVLMAQQLQNEGLNVRPILSPTVPRGSERIRICLHSFNTAAEILLLTETLNNIVYA